MRSTLMVVGAAGLLIGLLWLGQGAGWFPYPRSSFMIDQTPWAYRGVGMATIGVAAMMVSRSIGKR